MEREQGENTRRELDQEFDTLRSLLYATDPSSTADDAYFDDVNLLPASKARNEAYDQNVHDLADEKRAIPKDRTKTEEEIALEEKEALEKAERKRTRRMLGDEYDSDEDEGKGARGRRKRAPDADDLEDDFEDHDGEGQWPGLGSGLAEGA
jgi:nucleolar protein 14